MGHLRLGSLPATRNWTQVVALLDEGAETAQIAQATARAAQRGLNLADADAGLAYSFWLLSRIPLAAREENFAAALKQIGVVVPSGASVFDIVAGFTNAVNSYFRRGGRRTDIGEMAQLAATESLTSLSSRRSKGLFETRAEDSRNALRDLSTRKNFGILAQDFFARFMGRFLSYHLSRELSNHVGPSRRFASIAEHNAFNEALDLHCRQAARIVRDFAGGWHSKTNYESGIAFQNAKGFAVVAMKKMRDELERRGAC